VSKVEDRDGRLWAGCIAAGIWLSLTGPQPATADSNAGLAVPAGRIREPGWSPVIVATGEYRSSLQSLPIEHRPYRPLHFYGNTVRRLHHRGTPLPWPGQREGARSRRRRLAPLGLLEP
jgi:hypothetical protein